MPAPFLLVMHLCVGTEVKVLSAVSFAVHLKQAEGSEEAPPMLGDTWDPK